MNLSWYVPKDNVDYTISGQGTGISTLDHLATIPRACITWYYYNLYDKSGTVSNTHSTSTQIPAFHYHFSTSPPLCFDLFLPQTALYYPLFSCPTVSLLSVHQGQGILCFLILR